MRTALLRSCAYGILAYLTAGSAPLRPQAAAAGGNKIRLLSLDQPPCARPGTMLTAKLDYRLGPREQSAHGFAVSIKFATTDPGHTVSLGLEGEQVVTQRHDTVTLSYSLTPVLSHPGLKRPLTCYFYLHRNSSAGSSEVIASTPPVVLPECQ